MLKAFILVLALYLCINMVACTFDTGSSVHSTTADLSISSENNHTNFTNNPVFNDFGLSISLDNVRYERDIAELDLSIENLSNDNATLSGATFIVNGVMIDSFLYAPVASGAKANCTLYFDSSDLITAGIEEIYSVSSYDAHISFEESKGKDIPLEIILREEKTQDIDSSGKVLFEQNGITVISKFDPNKQTDNIPLLVINESGQDFNIWTEYVTVNGYTVPEWHYSYIVCDGASRFFEIELVSPDMGGSDIDTIETASFTLDFKVPGSSASICQTEQLEIP